MLTKIIANTTALITLSSLLTLLTTNQEVQALSFVRNFTGGDEPVNAAGGGNLFDIFNAAADVWEQAILDDYTLTLNFGWAPLNGFLALYSPDDRGGDPFREIEGTILFDNDGSSSFFLDPTPTENEEYLTFSEFSDDLGGGEVNTGRILRTPLGDAFNRTDLFTVALHEIGHSLGLLNTNFTFADDINIDGDIDIEAPRPLPGTQIPSTTVTGGHLDLSTTLMFAEIPISQRKLPSAVDILAGAEISEFNNLNLNPPQSPPEPPTTVPEPTSRLSLLFLGIFGLGFRLRKTRKPHRLSKVTGEIKKLS